MPDGSPALVGFNAGLFDSKATGRVDLDRYQLGCLRIHNILPEIEGPATKRPGTKHVCPAKYDERETRLIPFEFSNEQAYQLEVGDLYMRVHRNQATVLDSSAGKTISITGITAANPIVVTTFGVHTFSSGEHVWIDGTEIEELNGQFHRVGATTGTTFEIDLDGSTLTAQTILQGTAQAVYEISAPWLATEVSSIKFAQSLDVLYATCPTKPMKKVTRLADDDFTIAALWQSADLEDPDDDKLHEWPPFGVLQSAGAITLTLAANVAPGATTTLTASAALFSAGDVGKFIKLQVATPDAGFAEITGFTSSTLVTITVKSRFPVALVATATKNWAWNAFDNDRGHPRAIGFFESRMYVAGPQDLLQSWWASHDNDFENFRPYDDDGSGGFTIAADSGMGPITINSDKQNAIEWFLGLDTLFMGTRGGEFTIEGANIDQGIQPGNLFVKKRASYGSRVNVQPVAVDTVVLFAQRAGKKLRELSYSINVERFQAQNMNRLAREVIFGKAKYLDYQQEPNKIVWSAQEDGSLATFTYEREEGVFAWATQGIGGASVYIDSVSVIPAANDDEDEVWMVVRRTFNGVTTRSIEILNDYWDRTQDVEDAIFMDSSIGFESTQHTCSNAYVSYLFGAPFTNFCVSATHDFVVGDFVELVSNPLNTELEGKIYKVIISVGSTFTLGDEGGVEILVDAEMPNPGCVFRKAVNSLTGALHLAGQTVGVLASGVVRPDVTVSALGKVTLPFRSGRILIGHRYDAKLRTNRINSGSREGTSQGKPGSFKRAVLRLDQTARGLYIGTDFDDETDAKMDLVEWGTQDVQLDQKEQLFDGDTRRITIPGGVETDKTIALKHTEPLPCSVVAIFPKMNVQED